MIIKKCCSTVDNCKHCMLEMVPYNSLYTVDYSDFRLFNDNNKSGYSFYCKYILPLAVLRPFLVDTGVSTLVGLLGVFFAGVLALAFSDRAVAV